MCNRNWKNGEFAATTRPEFSKPVDMLSHYGRSLRDRYDALRPHSDVKNWR